MILNIVRRYRAVALTASMATRTEYLEGTGRVVAGRAATQRGAASTSGELEQLLRQHDENTGLVIEIPSRAGVG